SCLDQMLSLSSHSLPTINILPSKGDQVQTRNVRIQSTPYNVRNVRVQVRNTSHFSAQVSEVDLLPQGTIYPPEERVLDFLGRVVPLMLEELDRVSSADGVESPADSFSTGGVPELDYGKESVGVARRFSNSISREAVAGEGDVKCTCVCWSGNGLILAGGIGQPNQHGWGSGRDTVIDRRSE
ncbi:hypothetical protein FOZ62_008723, partial [Perkinsus olseni]